ncbi:adenylate/guanylate cyclase domain-containing protein [Vibrio owensii]|uniref:adenylate/guanylate cyclase domain-containing protein n=1 Tax=Vibrio harveyi group TaxID=717610 RepID=UPI003CC5B583
MSNTNQLSQTNVDNSLVRVLGYIFLSLIMIVYNITEKTQLDDLSGHVFIGLIVYLGFTFLAELGMRKYSGLIHYLLLFLDAIICGFFIYYIRTDLSLSFMLLIIQTYIFVSVGGLAFWFIYMAITLSTFGLLVFQEPSLYLSTTNLTMQFVGGIYTLIFIVVVSHQRYEKTLKLNEAQEIQKIKNNELEHLFKVLSNYLSPQLIGSIEASNGELPPAKRKQISICFTDIVGFSSMVESLDPEVTARLLNRYFQEMSTIALKHGGTIDKYLGDGMLIFFGDPSSKGLKEDAVACISMAIEMQQRVGELKEEWRENGLIDDFKIRIGINTGFCHVGNFGSNDRMDYTAVGKSVNIASRLESITKPGKITVGDKTYALTKGDFNLKFLGKNQLKGMTKPMSNYEVVCEDQLVKERFVIDGVEVQITGTQSELKSFKDKYEKH